MASLVVLERHLWLNLMEMKVTDKVPFFNSPVSFGLSMEPSVLPENVLNTISQARAQSTGHLYALKWSVFSTWCTTRGANPEVCDLSLILSFLQELLEKGRSPSTLKVYVAAIAASHAPIDGQSVGKNN